MAKKKPPAEAITASEPPGNPGGRTRQIRTYDMVGDWIYWISEVTGQSQAEVVDPWLRAPAYLRYVELLPQIEQLKKIRKMEDDVKSSR